MLNDESENNHKNYSSNDKAESSDGLWKEFVQEYP